MAIMHGGFPVVQGVTPFTLSDLEQDLRCNAKYCGPYIGIVFVFAVQGVTPFADRLGAKLRTIFELSIAYVGMLCRFELESQRT